MVIWFNKLRKLVIELADGKNSYMDIADKLQSKYGRERVYKMLDKLHKKGIIYSQRRNLPNSTII